MQVTIDTRHDTLEEALAVIQLAFAHVNGSASAGSAGPGRAGTKKAATKNRRLSRSATGPVAPAASKHLSARGQPHPGSTVVRISLLLARRRS